MIGTNKSKVLFGVNQVEHLGRTFSSEGVSPQTDKIHSFLKKLRFPKKKKAVQRYMGLVKY